MGNRFAFYELCHHVFPCSRLLLGESGCAQLPTPAALQEHCPFSTLHILTCLYKPCEDQPAVRCALLLYGPKAEQAKPRTMKNHIEEQSRLMSENSQDIFTIFDLQG